MLKKQFLKSKPICKVTFRILKGEVEAEDVTLVGEFNNWDKNATPMKALKKGGFTVTLDLETNRDFQFLYLADGKEWYPEKEADDTVFNEYGTENSVVKTYE